MSEILTTSTFEEMLAKVPAERVEQARTYWDGRTLRDVQAEMPPIERHGCAEIVVVEPDGLDIDETKTIVLPLEFTQPYTAPHYMRAKVLQQYVSPDSRVVVMPNSKAHVDLKEGLLEGEKTKLASGDYMPYGEILTKTLENADKKHNFGTLSLIGSSQAGTSVLAIAAAGSDRFDVDRVTAIEVPSKTGRGLGALALDFMKSGGDLSASVKESEIIAQLEAMRGLRLIWDLGKFGVASTLRAENRLIARSLTGSINEIAERALSQLDENAVNIIYAEDSIVFDPDSLEPDVRRSIAITKLVGEHVHGHSTPNNLRFNAAMAYKGLVAG